MTFGLLRAARKQTTGFYFLTIANQRLNQAIMSFAQWKCESPTLR